MRIAVVCGLVLLTGGTHVMAADMPYLRGSQVIEPGTPAYPRWDGAYYGVQGGYSSANSNFRTGTSDLVAYILRNTTIENEAQVSQWTTMPSAGATGANFGAFIGYNGQWDEAVLGLELNYTHSDLQFGAGDGIGRSFQTSDNYLYNVAVGSRVALNLTDYGTLRVRAGWAAGNVMPYGFFAGAVARSTLSRTATVTLSARDLLGTRGDIPEQTQSLTDQSTSYSFGYALGGGIDVAYWQNIFLRAEYEYTRFGSVKGSIVSFNTIRAALGVRF